MHCSCLHHGAPARSTGGRDPIRCVGSGAARGAFARFRGACLGLAASLLLAGVNVDAARAASVEALVETDPVPSSSDAADDASFWIHPTDPSLSTVIGTDKLSGLGVYDLDGNELQFVTYGNPNNVDLRYHFPTPDGPRAIIAASERDAEAIVVFAVNPTTGLLETPAIGTVPLTFEPYGICMYLSPLDGRYHVFVNSKAGDYEQWHIAPDGLGGVLATRVREFSVSTQPEGCVADDELGDLYVGEEDVGIWRFGAEPTDGSDRVMVDTTDGSGHLTAQVEGLTIYYAAGGTGYLLASSQGSDSYVIYERGGANAYVASFEIADGASIDGTQTTDGIDVTNVPLGSGFPFGAFVAQDGVNNGSNQNFKLVPWESLAGAFEPALTIDTSSFDPRAIGADTIHLDDFETGTTDRWTSVVAP